MSLFPFHFWRIVSPEIEFAIDSSLLSALEKFVLLPSGLYRFRWEIHCHFNWCSPIDNSNFSLGTFSISSLSLVFRSLIMMCLILDFFFFSIYPVWIHLTSWIYRLFFAYPLGGLQPLFLQIFFYPYSSVLTWDPNDMNIRPFDVVLQVFIPFKLFFPISCLLFMFSKLCSSVLKFADSVFYCTHSTIELV